LGSPAQAALAAAATAAGHTTSEPCVGIDLGTTFSVVAHLDRDGKPLTIPNVEGQLATPSVVFFDRRAALVGREAERAAEFEPVRAARFVKRDMGDSVYHQDILGKQFPPEAIQALILRSLKHDTEQKLGPFRKAVLTVPAYFTEPRRKATQDAGLLADLDVIDIINEPTAAAIAYGVQTGFLSAAGRSRQRELILVYDLGGGTFDATLMEIDGAAFMTVATAGDVRLGGIDWDARIADFLALRFRDNHGLDPRESATSRETLMQEAAAAKKALTSRREVTVRFAHEGIRSQLTITRDEFESHTADLLDRTQMTLWGLLKEAKVCWRDITRLLLVGGSTRMPMVQRMLTAESGLTLDRSLSPDEAVAHGAAIYARVLLGGEESRKRTFGRTADGNQPPLTAPSPPLFRSVGRGKAPPESADRLTVHNVNSHDLGILAIEPSTGRRRRQIVIPRNSCLPATRSRDFRTSKDGQQQIAVMVVEGGTDTGEGATPIGSCVVSDLPPDLPKGAGVVVTFMYRADGRLTVRAQIPAANCEAQATIDRASGMTEPDLQAWKRFLDSGGGIGPSDEDYQESAST
jgi:molecular chaperone DnaK